MAAPTQAICNSFKNELFTATHNFSTHTFKAALFKAAASVVGTYGAATTNYSQLTTDELGTGSGYTATGNDLAVAATFPKLVNSTAVVDFDDESWTTATFTTSGALVYNNNASGAAVCLLNFGGDKSVTSGTFTIVFPVGDDSTGFLRLA